MHVCIKNLNKLITRVFFFVKVPNWVSNYIKVFILVKLIKLP